MAKTNLIIQQGKTFAKTVRYEGPDIIYHPVSSIEKTAPVRISFLTPHPFYDGQRVAITGVLGMKQINATTVNPVSLSEYLPCKVVSSLQIEINSVNASGFTPYKSGGVVQALVPIDLTGYTGRFVIKNRVGGNILFTSQIKTDAIQIDVINNSIKLSISAEDTASFSWTNGVYEVELEDSDGFVVQLLYGNIKVEKEIAS